MYIWVLCPPEDKRIFILILRKKFHMLTSQIFGYYFSLKSCQTSTDSLLILLEVAD